MSGDDKPLVWLRGEVKSPPFSKDARLEAGFLLRRLQPARRGSGSTMMRKSKQKKLEENGWRIGSADEFLDLSSEESAYIDLKLRLSDRKLSQQQLAMLIKSSQSRVAKMEAGDPTVSLDLLVKTLLALGASDRDLANAITAK
jgi:hypothetical protein